MSRARTHSDIWVTKPYSFIVKMTIDVDERKLRKVMTLTEIKTKTAAIDYALVSAEKTARREKVLGKRLSPEDLVNCINPGYDVLALREAGRSM